MRHPSPVLAEDRRRRFEDIYAANAAPILGYAVRRTSNGEDAADIVAETFLTAWRRLDDVPSGAQARLWLYGVARRVLANYHRGERRKTELSERLGADLALVHTDPEYTGRLALVAAAFRSLTEADRELLALVGWEALDHGEISAVLGCSRNAVRVRLHRARARFAQAVGQLETAPRYDVRFPVTNGERA